MAVLGSFPIVHIWSHSHNDVASLV